jgi:plastocyanin
VIVGSLLAGLALLPAAPAAPVARSAAHAPSTTVGVSAREFAFAAYRSSAPAGAVTFIVHNYGEDDHDLQIRGPHGYRSATSATIEPDGTVRLATHLRRPGTYLLVCTEPGHLARGMEASLRVR